MRMEDARFSRRNSLLRLGGLAAGILSLDVWRGTPSEGAGPAAVASGAVRCVLAPEQTEGPYYIPGELVRRNITEGRPGRPLLLRTTVVDASTCRAIRGAAVDIWHADALGVYSGFGAGAQNHTFMRGVQRTDARGLAAFRSVYPGWYPGRAVHIHVKVHVGGNVVHTGQLYFPDAITDAAYRTAPYNTRPSRTTRNPDDAIYRNGGKRSLVALRRSGAAYVASITMGVHRA
jgi:protocatechuate 3,4-dioxygenase beta subunit